VYQESTGGWWVWRSTDGGLGTLVFGGPGYTAVHGDFDADGKADVAVYGTTTGVWWVYRSRDQQVSATTLGGSGATPVRQAARL
jgi:hypothetical protein